MKMPGKSASIGAYRAEAQRSGRFVDRFFFIGGRHSRHYNGRP